MLDVQVGIPEGVLLVLQCWVLGAITSLPAEKKYTDNGSSPSMVKEQSRKRN
jgi:hypothetical protein